MRWPYPRTPALGRGLPSNYAEGEKMFDARVKAMFPVGTPEARLVDALRRQGFAVESAHRPDCRSATVMKGLVFRHIWSVRWRSAEGRVEDIRGVYGVIAP